MDRIIVTFKDTAGTLADKVIDIGKEKTNTNSASFTPTI